MVALAESASSNLCRVGSMVLASEEGPRIIPSASQGSVDSPPGASSYAEMHSWHPQCIEKMQAQSDRDGLKWLDMLLDSLQVGIRTNADCSGQGGGDTAMITSASEATKRGKTQQVTFYVACAFLPEDIHVLMREHGGRPIIANPNPVCNKVGKAMLEDICTILEEAPRSHHDAAYFSSAVRSAHITANRRSLA